MLEPMNIYAEYGDKVRFAFPYNGYKDEREEVAKMMNVGDVFTVDCTSVGGSHSSVYLQEFPDIPFNTVFFEDVQDTLAILVNEDFEEHKSLVNLDKHQLLMTGDCYHDKIDERIEGYLQALEDNDLWSGDVQESYIGIGHKYYKLAGF